MIQDVKEVKMFSECLKGKIPVETRLDTEALINFLMLDNVSEIEASIRKGCIRATHFIGSDKKFIYDTGISRHQRPQTLNRTRQPADGNRQAAERLHQHGDSDQYRRADQLFQVVGDKGNHGGHAGHIGRVATTVALPDAPPSHHRCRAF